MEFIKKHFASILGIKTTSSSPAHADFMEEAVRLSIQNVQKNMGGPFGCVILDSDGQTILGKGCNSVVRNNDPTAHAEIVALRDACNKKQTWDLSGCRVYSSCEPCPMCFSALMWAKVDHIFYSNTRKDAGAIGFQDDFLYEILKGHSDKLDDKVSRIYTSGAITAFQLWKEAAQEEDLY